MIRGSLAQRAVRLVAAREAFVEATVVRAVRPTSVRPGDPALVLADGTIEGFVGGVCAEEAVRLHALRALETGEPLLLRFVPEEAAGSAADAVGDGAVVERNPCLSGGALEIFLEPCLPSPRLVVIGDAPVARALALLGADAGFAVARGEPVGTGGGRRPDARGEESVSSVEPATDDAALVVASHGRDEEDVLAAGLRAGVAYVGLVASARRGAAVRAALDVPDELRAQLHTPAGLPIGARTPTEIALAILAEIVAERRATPADAAPPAVAADLTPPAAIVAPPAARARDSAHGPACPHHGER
jgi:xanthine dehydrogenase accessory factor